MPIWWQLEQYSLFPFDAAGLLTLLGVDEVNHAVGRLVRSRYLEFMPLLAPFVITGNRFVEKIAGYQVYDLTGGVSTEIGIGWFTRYLISHEENIESTRSILLVKDLESPRNATTENLCALLVSGLFFGILITFTILAGDWWGLGSTVGVVVSVIVRYVLVEANRRSIDWALDEHRYQTSGQSSSTTLSKILLETRESKMLTILIPRSLIAPVLVRNPTPRMPRGYKGLRYSGWIAFISHIIAINQACFTVRVVTTLTLVVDTVLYSWKFGCTDSTWFWQSKQARSTKGHNAMLRPITTFLGTRLKLELTQWPSTYEFVWSQDDRESRVGLAGPQGSNLRSNKRMDLYAWLNLSHSEEESLGKWDLLPHMRDGNESWWYQYMEKKKLISERGLVPSAIYNGLPEEDAGTPVKPEEIAEAQDSTGVPSQGPKRTATVLVEEGGH